MKLDQPASERRSLFGEKDAVLQSHPLLESARHPDAAVPRFGDTVGWDFNGIVRRPANLSPAEWRIQFSSGLEEPRWNLLARELLTAMANPHHEVLQEAGVYLGTAQRKSLP
ncbi:hypothetical protein [Amycolatopsis keratiniphila]|uniref:Uncharacterized protein n=1 Tax=Amycolatopsis keratiniphila TaxID=129921 RepID=R4SX30_9PSEU|nr:hypothetical protein [Amycolatopsis keratiniphila]AGM07090.1 hypothetical protein AORI_4506 [Amycolatopsis keratiniphila]